MPAVGFEPLARHTLHGDVARRKVIKNENPFV